MSTLVLDVVRDKNLVIDTVYMYVILRTRADDMLIRSIYKESRGK